jgi:RsiW-degrading membrane proteinase PrsW (M82 family)
MTILALKLLIGALPVLMFLLLLIILDSYKLVGFRFVIKIILWGCGIAILCLGINSYLIRLMNMSQQPYSRYIAPCTEEFFKSLFIIYLIRRKRVGFLVDAAIVGFALGAGFAIVENIYNIHKIQSAGMYIWLVRGFGTAVMHGGVTAIFGIVSKGLSDSRARETLWVFLPGLGLAILIHSLFNHFFISPEHSTIGLTIGIPLLMIVVFQQSERVTRRWLGVGFDSDAELLDMLVTGNISHTKIGEYLNALKERFPGESIADMLCLLRIHLELSIRAKGILLAREAGLDIPRDPELEGKFTELKYLEHSIGRTGVRAMAPFLHRSSRELWQLHMLLEQ